MYFFVIKSDQITRLKAFETISKKVNAIQPLDQKCLFYIKDNKLSIYGYGGGAFGHGSYTSTFDIESENEFSFLSPVNDFIKLLEKTKSESINVSFDEKTSRVTIKGDKSRSIWSSIVLTTTDGERDEITAFLPSFKNGAVYQNGLDITLTPELKEAISSFCSLTGLLHTNDNIVLEKDTIKTIDNLSVIKQHFNSELVPKAIYLNKLCSPIVDKLSVLRYCEFNDYSAIYGNIDDLGFEFFITQPPVNYQNVSDEEAATIIPLEENQTVIKFKSEELLNALDEFEGVFASGSWIYKQVYFKFDKEQKTICLEYNDMANQCVTDVSYEEISSVNDDGEPVFLIPTIHIKYLKQLISSEDEITLTFNCNSLEEPNSQAVIFKNEKVTALLMKMAE